MNIFLKRLLIGLAAVACIWEATNYLSRVYKVSIPGYPEEERRIVISLLHNAILPVGAPALFAVSFIRGALLPARCAAYVLLMLGVGPLIEIVRILIGWLGSEFKLDYYWFLLQVGVLQLLIGIFGLLATINLEATPNDYAVNKLSLRDISSFILFGITRFFTVLKPYIGACIAIISAIFIFKTINLVMLICLIISPSFISRILRLIRDEEQKVYPITPFFRVMQNELGLLVLGFLLLVIIGWQRNVVDLLGSIGQLDKLSWHVILPSWSVIKYLVLVFFSGAYLFMAIPLVALDGMPISTALLKSMAVVRQNIPFFVLWWIFLILLTFMIVLILSMIKIFWGGSAFIVAQIISSIIFSSTVIGVEYKCFKQLFHFK
jgi:hypothetical protein